MAIGVKQADPTIPAERAARTTREQEVVDLFSFTGAPSPEAVKRGLDAAIDFTQRYGPSVTISAQVGFLLFGAETTPAEAQEIEDRWLPTQKDDLSVYELEVVARQVTQGAGSAAKAQRLLQLLAAGTGITRDELNVLTQLAGDTAELDPAIRTPLHDAALSLINDRLAAVLGRPELKPEDTFEAVNLALGVDIANGVKPREAWMVADPDAPVTDTSPDVTAKLDAAMKSQKHVGVAADQYRRYFASRPAATTAQLVELGRTLAQRPGGLDRAGVRLLAARIDADGRRDEVEKAALEQLKTLDVSPDARPLFERLLSGVTKPEDLADPPAAPVSTHSIVWENANRELSHGRTREVDLPGLKVTPEGVETSTFKIVAPGARVIGVAPDPDGDGVTDPNFDVVNVAYHVQTVFNRLAAVGIDVEKLLGGRKITIDVHAPNEPSARFEPLRLSLLYGTLLGALNTAEDGKTVVHELGHLLIDLLNRGMDTTRSPETQALHEGFADALAALIFDDPAISESLGFMFTRPGAAVRKLEGDDEADLGWNAMEGHLRGRAYGAFFWDLRLALKDLGIPPEQAVNFGLQWWSAAISELGTSDPTMAEIYVATERGLATALALHRDDPALMAAEPALRMAMTAAATRRGLLDQGLSEADEKTALAMKGARKLSALVKDLAPTAESLAAALTGRPPDWAGVPGANDPYLPYQTLKLLDGTTKVIVMHDTHQHAWEDSNEYLSARFDAAGKLIALSADYCSGHRNALGLGPEPK